MQHVLVQAARRRSRDGDLAQRLPRLGRRREPAGADRVRQRGQRIPRDGEHDERRDADPDGAGARAHASWPAPSQSDADQSARFANAFSFGSASTILMYSSVTNLLAAGASGNVPFACMNAPIFVNQPSTSDAPPAAAS